MMLLATFLQVTQSDAPHTSIACNSRLDGDSAGGIRQCELLLPNHVSDVRSHARKNGALHLPDAQRHVRHERQNAAPRLCVGLGAGANSATSFL
jgi:hypothetical protein